MADDVIFGRVPKPPMQEMICPKPYDGAGFTRLAKPRQPVGVCDHITAGGGSLEFYQGFFSTGGERALDALVDVTIDKGGRIGVFNPFLGTRSPWANGGSDGLEGDGPAYVAKLGVNAINDRLISKEHVGDGETPWPDAQWEASIAFDAWWFDQLGFRWDTYPVHPTLKIVTHMLHFEFATKPCPGSWLRNNIGRKQALVRERMKAAQAVDPGVPTPPPPQPRPPSLYPKGMTEAKASELFGKLTRHRPDGSTTEHGFNERGTISRMWLQRCKAKNAWPSAADLFSTGDDPDDREVMTFTNGWVAVKRNDRAGWRWVADN